MSRRRTTISGTAGRGPGWAKQAPPSCFLSFCFLKNGRAAAFPAKVHFWLAVGQVHRKHENTAQPEKIQELPETRSGPFKKRTK
jgi:hypothetical protein